MPHRFACLLLLALCQPASAFESWEHKRLGDLAYHVAVSVYCKGKTADGCDKAPGRPGESTLWFYDPYLSKAPAPDNKRFRALHYTTYGDIVMCVDYFLTPEKLIGGRETSLINEATLPPEQGVTTPDQPEKLFPRTRTELDIAYGTRCDASWSNLEGMRAGHVNHNHFQAELIVAQRHNHLLALAMRTVDDNLFSALALNAVSDHYLQDIFAPGHIMTWRARLTDLAANAFHDKYNNLGLTAFIQPKDMRVFLRLETAAQIDDDNTSIIAALKKKLKEPGISETFLMPPKGLDCGEACHASQRAAAADWGARLASMDELLRELERGSSEIEVNIRGDERLWSVAHDRQRLVMLLIEVRSILDVLESHPEAQAERDHVKLVDSFKSNKWKWSYVSATPRPRPGIKDMLFKSEFPSRLTATVGPVNYRLSDEDYRADDNKSTGQAQERFDYLTYLDMDTVLGASYGMDNMNFGDMHNRHVFNFEAIVWGRARARSSNGNAALTVGIQPFFSNGPNGYALAARYIKVWPAIEAEVSFPLRLLRLKRPDGSATWRPSAGIRLDAGFTSFLTFYLQAGYDAAVQKSGELRRGLSLGAGVQLGAPNCRVPGIKKLCQ